ncbi:hypothetical protein HK405_007500, partial [Cladochytrium tenue]
MAIHAKKAATFGFATVAALAMAARGGLAHGYMKVPLPTWPSGFFSINSPSATVDPASCMPQLPGFPYNWDPLTNTNSYWTAFNQSSYTSLRDLAYKCETLVSPATHQCGYSLVTGTPRDLPANVEWDVLTSSHQGPLEIWCDDTLVFMDPNAALHYTSSPAVLPYDIAKCQGAKVLQSIWIALHSPPWQ